MTDFSNVVRHSEWVVFHNIKLQLPWSLIVVCTIQFPFPESVGIKNVFFKRKTNCVSCTSWVIFHCNWVKFSTPTHKPPPRRRVIWNVFPYLVWTRSVRSLPSDCSRRILPPSVILNSDKRRQANVVLLYGVAKSKWRRKKSIRKE